MTPRQAHRYCVELAERLDDAPETPVQQELRKLADNVGTALDTQHTRRARLCALLQARSSEARAHVQLEPGDDPLRWIWGELASALRLAESIFAMDLEVT